MLDEPLDLPCGLRLPNRLVRAAMTESLADRGHEPSDRLRRLYTETCAAGAGLVLTGNVMVDRRHLERSRNVVVDATTDLAALRRWAESCAAAPTFVQLSHPGRQTSRFVNPHPVAPSAGPAVALAGLFAAPRALTRAEIGELRDRFVDAGRRLVAAGFPGVQVHGAHGYLLSSFLDPRHNQRDDEYGGDLAGRARLLLEIVEGLRQVLPREAGVAVKLDSRDGGLDDLVRLAGLLETAGVDLVEVSGGSYEDPAMVGLDADGRPLETGPQESPFSAAAVAVAAATTVPVVLTGGFLTRAAMERTLGAGVAAVGAGRPLAVRPRLAGELVRAEADSLDRPAPRLGGPTWFRRTVGVSAGPGWHRLQLARTAAGRPPALRLPALLAAADYAALDSARALVERRSRMRRADLADRRSAPTLRR